MGSREKILQALQNCNLPPVPAPDPVAAWYEDGENIVKNFVQTLQGIGGECTLAGSFAPVNDHLRQLQEKGLPVVNAIPEIDSYNVEQYQGMSAGDLQHTDTFFVKGKLGVAENGAIWITEKELHNRLFPFIAHNLVMVIFEKDIVTNMHRAYERIQVDAEGYGVFIAGPSKTADIEQSLVIGAHGPLSLQVFIIQQQN